MRALKLGSLGANAGWLLAGRGLSIVLQAGYFVALAHLLGSAQYGIYVGAFALVALVSQYSTVGSQLVFMRHVSSHPEKFGEYWGNILAVTVSLGSVLGAIMAIAGHRLLPTCPQILIVCIGFSECLFAQLTAAVAVVFQSFEQMRRTVAINFSVNGLRAILAIVLLLRFQHLSALQWGYATSSVSLCAALGAVAAVTAAYGWPRFSLASIRRHLGEGFVFAVSSSTTNVYNDVDKVMLGHYGMTVANGIYTMAYKAIDVAALPISSIYGAAFPRFFRLGANGVCATGEYAKKLVSRTAPMGLGIAAAIWVLAPLAPHILGHSFAASASALRWLFLLPLFRGFHLSAGDALAGAGHQNWRFVGQATAAGFNFLINLWLIPHFGWQGAAFASLLTDGGLGCFSWGILTVMMRHESERRSAAVA